ncbi:MAG TPA: succinylglutamate desuccinylase [Flavobacteriales bacterium]|nr:succinylglutamate desuccinylase [Flavobacteriales bacterium]
MNREFKIRDEIILPGETKHLDFFISRLPTGTVINMPVIVGRSKRQGPTLLLSAGMHGDEINGVEIVRRIVKERLFVPKRGSVICIPIVNTLGFINFSRENSGGKDVNRSFPGTQTGSLASQIAYFLSSEILPLIDCGIDFHTGGNRINNFPQIRTVFNHAPSLELARVFSAPYTLNAPLRDKSLRKHALSFEKPILVYEAGESMRLRKHSVDVGVNGALRVMKHLGMRDEAPTPRIPSTSLKKSVWVRAKRSGMHHSVVRYGSEVSVNDVIGHITDPYGKSQIVVKSPSNGHIIAINNLPIINRGDALFHLGFENDD